MVLELIIASLIRKILTIQIGIEQLNKIRETWHKFDRQFFSKRACYMISKYSISITRPVFPSRMNDYANANSKKIKPFQNFLSMTIVLSIGTQS